MTTHARLVLVNTSRADWCYPVKTARQIVGTSQEADVQVPDSFRSVSPRHAEIWYDAESIWMCDLQSQHGTRVNGVWLQHNAPAMLIVGDRLILGNCELQLEPAAHRLTHQPEAHSSSHGDATTPAVDAFLEPQAIARLSFAEHNIVLWMGRGYVHDQELSKQLHRSPHTIRTQIGSILKKLQVRSRTCLVKAFPRDGAAHCIRRAGRHDHEP